MDVAVKEDVKKRCIELLVAAGASNEQCQFYADALQCEYETLHVTYRLLGELRNGAKAVPINVANLVSIILKMNKSFIRWKTELDDLAARRISIPPLNVNLKNIANNSLLTALCSIQTTQMKLDQGDELMVTDATKPNQIKVRNAKGEEGYIPALSCILPAPDDNATNAIERLQIQLLVSWTDCEAKIRPVLNEIISSSSAQLVKDWASHNGGVTNGNTWEVRVSRRMKRIVEAMNGDRDSLDFNRLRKTFCSLENELIWQNSEKLLPMIKTVADLDSAVLSYQAFRKHWRQYRHSLCESVRPITIVVQWDPKIFVGQNKHVRYYEVKLTAEDTVTKEENVYISPKRSDDDETILLSGNSKRESVAAEQLTSTSHEESKRFIVKSVIDPRDGREISIQEAVSDGIIDHEAGVYRNPATGAVKNIAQAMSDGLIRIEYATTKRTKEVVQSLGLITIKTQIDNREYTLTGAVDAMTGERLDVAEARRRGILNETEGYYFNERTGLQMVLDDAIDAGWVLAEYDNSASGGGIQYETKTYAISAVVDQKQQKPVPFVEAIRHGLIDRDTGNYVNNKTGEKVYATEAIRRGFFKSMVVDNPLDLNIDVSNRVVVDRIEKVRKNVLRGVRVMAAFSKGLKKKDGNKTET